MGYYKIKQEFCSKIWVNIIDSSQLIQCVSNLIDFIDTLKIERKEEMQDKYLWLDSTDDRKYMSYKEILGKYID